MSLAQLIQQHAADVAAANDWAGVAAALSAKTLKVSLGKVGGKASLAALVASGEDPNAVIGAMRSVPMASVLLDTLIASGVDWDDPMTGLIMGGLVEAGLINPGVVTAMQSLSVRMDSLAGSDVTAEECAAAWSADQKRSRVDALASLWVSALNEGINEALASGDKSQLAVAMRAAVDRIEVG